MEILYKAKRKDTGEWVEGYYCRYQPCASKNEYINGIIPSYASALYIVETDPETVCVYTGMKDKDGRRIWENDIVKCNKRKDGFEVYKVVWRSQYADFGVEPLQYGVQYPIGSGENEQDISGHDYEVVGNVFDNLDLMERTVE